MSNKFLQPGELVTMLQVLQATPTMYAWIDESIANELEDSQLFDVSEYRITAQARKLLAESEK